MRLCILIDFKLAFLNWVWMQLGYNLKSWRQQQQQRSEISKPCRTLTLLDYLLIWVFLQHLLTQKKHWQHQSYALNVFSFTSLRNLMPSQNVCFETVKPVLLSSGGFSFVNVLYCCNHYLQTTLLAVSSQLSHWMKCHSTFFFTVQKCAMRKMGGTDHRWGV